METISVDTARWVADLARLHLEDEDLEKTSRQLTQIIEYVQQLQAVDTEGIEPTTHVLDLSNVLRPDRVADSLDPETVVSLAPSGRAPFVNVPKVIEA